jgi:uncharacterized membrane protein
MATRDKDEGDRDGPHNALLEGRAGEVRDYFLERTLMLSDGVFAVAITLMAIEVHPPKNWDGTWMGLWLGSWQTMGAYIVSFAAVGAFWIGHRRVFQHMRRANGPLTVLNLLVLGLVALVPAGAQLIYEYGPHGVALQTYIALIGSVGVAQALLWGYASMVGRLIHEHIPMQLRLVTFLTMLLAPIVSVTTIMFGMTTGRWWVPLIAVALLMGVNRYRRSLARRFDLNPAS